MRGGIGRLGFAIGLTIAACSFRDSRTAADEKVFPNPGWTTAEPRAVGLDRNSLTAARDYALTGDGSGCIVCDGRLVMTWGDQKQRYDLKSTTKSIGVTALGLSILDGKIDLDDKASAHHPGFGVPPESNRETGWLNQITIRHLAAQTAGFAKPGGYETLVFAPGTQWGYSDGGPNWLAECVTLAYRQDVDALLFDRVFTPLGIRRSDLVWRNNSYRPKEIEGIPRREFGSGISANVDAMARIGLLYLREGEWNGKRLLPRDFVKQAVSTSPANAGLPVVDPKNYGQASAHYGLLWWNNADGALEDVPRDAYWSWGLYDSLIVVIPSLDIVVARAGKPWRRDDGGDHYDVLHPFLAPIVAAVQQPNLGNANAASPPYPASSVITGIEWAPVESIVRRAPGGDNWPITWADDNALYTAYGDGKGFAPFVETKLSLGLARITGPADGFEAINLRAPTIETLGDGAKGKKASGLLMVDGVLYLWARNAHNSQLAWSHDRGREWIWSDWRFTASFGCPTFLNFGRNYAGARDSFVYIYSHDRDSAYEPADRMVLARTPAGRIAQRSSYEFFAGRDDSGEPIWTSDIERRAQTVFVVPDSSGRRPAICGRLRHLRGSRTVGTVDDRVLYRELGRRPRRDRQHSHQVDQRRRQNDPPRFFGGRPLFSASGETGYRPRSLASSVWNRDLSRPVCSPGDSPSRLPCGADLVDFCADFGMNPGSSGIVLLL